MPIVVETGSNVAGAEAWADQSAFAYWQVKFQGAEAAEATALQEAAIRRSVAYLDALPWGGTKTHGRSQATSFPRTGLVDGSGDAVGSDEIPAELIKAQHMLAWAELKSNGILNPSVNMANSKVLTKADVIGWTHTGGETASIDAHRTLLIGAIDLIVGLLTEDVRDVKDYDDVYFGVIG